MLKEVTVAEFKSRHKPLEQPLHVFVADTINEFISSGFKLAEVTDYAYLFDGLYCNPRTQAQRVTSRIYYHIKKYNLDDLVSVSQRKGHIYLIRIGGVDGA